MAFECIFCIDLHTVTSKGSLWQISVLSFPDNSETSLARDGRLGCHGRKPNQTPRFRMHATASALPTTPPCPEREQLKIKSGNSIVRIKMRQNTSSTNLQSVVGCEGGQEMCFVKTGGCLLSRFNVVEVECGLLVLAPFDTEVGNAYSRWTVMGGELFVLAEEKA